MTGSASLCEQHCDDRHFHCAVIVLTSKSRRLSIRTHTQHMEAKETEARYKTLTGISKCVAEQ